eukprot:COSAG05_NODE_1003_length_6237_cov_7.337732_2_plen_170_part_00
MKQHATTIGASLTLHTARPPRPLPASQSSGPPDAPPPRHTYTQQNIFDPICFISVFEDPQLYNACCAHHKRRGIGSVPPAAGRLGRPARCPPMRSGSAAASSTADLRRLPCSDYVINQSINKQRNHKNRLVKYSPLFRTTRRTHLRACAPPSRARRRRLTHALTCATRR